LVQDIKDRMAADVRAATTALLRPGSVAIIGASEDPSLPGGRLLHALVEGRYPGPIYPVIEPKQGARRAPNQVLALRALHNISELPDGVDMAVVVLPPNRATATTAELVKRGIRAIIVPVPGFAEAHEEGRRLQHRMVASARCGGARLLGPNTLGLYSREARVNLVNGIDPTPAGIQTARRPRVAFLSQAGELDQVYIDTLLGHREAVSLYVSLGNAADVGFEHLLRGAVEEPAVAAVAIVAAGEVNVPALASTIRDVSARVPVLVTPKVRGKAALRAARSHTGGATEAQDAMPDLVAAGAIASRDIVDLADRTTAVVNQPMSRGRRVAVLSTSGGAAVAASSHLADLGLEVPVLPREVQSVLRSWLPDHAGSSNPVNLTGTLPGGNYLPLVSGVLGQASVDGALVLAVGVDPPALAKAVIEASKRRTKPVVGVTVGAPRTEAALVDAGIPVYPTPARAARAYQALVPLPL
jgi:acyl-CoA synthetase (NDP forming)